MQDLIQVATPFPQVQFLWCEWWYGKHSPVWYVIVYYVSKHKHKDDLRTFGTVLDQLEAS